MALKEQISVQTKALVVGASMVGIKVVEALVKLGADVSLSDMQEHVFPLSAYAECASRIESHLGDIGVGLYLGQNKPDLARFDTIVVCVGVRPNIGFLDKAQVDTDRGVIVDRFMRSGCDGLYAAGDCAQIRDDGSGCITSGLWASARYMGRTAGGNIAGRNDACFEVIPHNNTRFLGMDFISIGDISQCGDVFEMELAGKYCKIVRKDDRIVGINLLNMPEVSGILKSMTYREPDLLNAAVGKLFGSYPRIREFILKDVTR